MEPRKACDETCGCDETCSCPSPCPGGIACRCTSSETSDVGEPEIQHMHCSCGDHCGCNPCLCLKTEVLGTGKAFCKCGKGCTCVTCTT